MRFQHERRLAHRRAGHAKLGRKLAFQMVGTRGQAVRQDEVAQLVNGALGLRQTLAARPGPFGLSHPYTRIRFPVLSEA